ncbi:MAG: cytochrome c [Deltaproteobacteria bacterium]|nr:cytochrome c [Deltaproteobacteria bacterium]
MIRTQSLLLALTLVIALGSGCENPDPTAPVALPDERPMPVWGMDFGKAPATTLDADALVRPTTPGEALFKNHCASCHGATAGGTAMGPAINGALTSSKTDAVLASTVMAGKAAMPSFKGRLSDAQITSILTWLRTQDASKIIAPSPMKPTKAGAPSGDGPPAAAKPSEKSEATKPSGAKTEAIKVPAAVKPVSTRPVY